MFLHEVVNPVETINYGLKHNSNLLLVYVGDINKIPRLSIVKKSEVEKVTLQAPDFWNFYIFKSINRNNIRYVMGVLWNTVSGIGRDTWKTYTSEDILGLPLSVKNWPSIEVQNYRTMCKYYRLKALEAV